MDADDDLADADADGDGDADGDIKLDSVDPMVLRGLKEQPRDRFPLQLAKMSWEKTDQVPYIGFELKNVTSRPLEVDEGFRLSNWDGLKQLDIGKRQMKPKEVLRVVVGTEEDKQAPTDLVWGKGLLWDGKTPEKLVVLDGKGNYIVFWESDPQIADQHHSCFVM